MFIFHCVLSHKWKIFSNAHSMTCTQARDYGIHRTLSLNGNLRPIVVGDDEIRNCLNCALQTTIPTKSPPPVLKYLLWTPIFNLLDCNFLSGTYINNI